MQCVSNPQLIINDNDQKTFDYSPNPYLCIFYIQNLYIYLFFQNILVFNLINEFF
jgi:hypothetical protein